MAVRAQQEPSFSHYWAMEPSFNPAAAGKEQKVNAVGAYNMTMAGFEHNPRTMYFAADMPLTLLGATHGIGVQLVNDDIGLFSHQRLALQYAYKHRLLGGIISGGLQMGLLSEKFKGSQVDTEAENDPVFSKSDDSGTGTDLSLGLYYQRGPWYVAASALHLTAPSIDIGERSILEMSRVYYLTGGYNIQLRNPLLSIHPSMLARYDGVGYRVDLTARLRYTHDGKMMYAGLGCSPGNSVSAYIGGNFHGVTLGYSYEMYTSAISIGNGSHELFVGYQTELNLFKKGRNKHQSVRFL